MHSERTLEIESTSPAATRALGERLGAVCAGGEVLFLSGDLGAGKTCLVQGLAAGLGVPEDEPVCSPTFVLHCQYFGRLELNHIDLYRLGEQIDLEHTGFDHLLGAAGAVAAVEWAEFLGPLLHQDHLGLHLAAAGESVRRVRFSALGAGPRELLDRLRRSLAQEPVEGVAFL